MLWYIVWRNVPSGKARCFGDRNFTQSLLRTKILPSLLTSKILPQRKRQLIYSICKKASSLTGCYAFPPIFCALISASPAAWKHLAAWRSWRYRNGDKKNWFNNKSVHKKKKTWRKSCGPFFILVISWLSLDFNPQKSLMHPMRQTSQPYPDKKSESQGCMTFGVV